MAEKTARIPERKPIASECGKLWRGRPVPIRFRCAYCNQLMGISRRKAGTVVRCPTCSGQVVVPNPDTEAPVMPKPGEKTAAPNLFEQSDFDELLRPGGAASPTATVSSGEVPAHPQGPMTGAW